MMETNQPSGSGDFNFISALCFVRRGVAKSKPEKIDLTQEELNRIIGEMREGAPAMESGESNSENDEAGSEEGNNEGSQDVDMEGNADADGNQSDGYNFNSYDDESNVRVAHLNDVVQIDPYNTGEDDEDSEAEDDIIKPTDNLILVGRATSECPSLEVWIFNEDEQSLYTHHDFILPNNPLCIEWLNYEPDSSSTGHLCAIGSMDPIVTVWDLDIQDCVEPVYKLGSKRHGKGHTSAVLDLAWNEQFPHVLASASADYSVLLWDLDLAKFNSVLNFRERPESICFQQSQPQNLLIGCDDGTIRLIDCRDPDTTQKCKWKWKLRQNLEQVMWNPTKPDEFVAGTSSGELHYADARNTKQFVWSSKIHNNEISGICFNIEKPNLLVTSSTDGSMKILKFDENGAQEIHSHDFGMGRLQTMQQCPEDPFTVAVGGHKVPYCQVYNIKNFEAVRRAFDIPDVLE